MRLPTHISSFFNNRYVIYSLFLIILVLSSIIRLKPVYEGNFPYLYDHGRDLLEVKKIVHDKDFTLIGPTTGLPGVFHGPWHFYLLAIGYIFSGGNPASGVFLTVLCQLLGGVICFVLGKKLYSVSFGLFLSLFFLLAQASITVSNMFWNPHWIPFFMVLFYFSLFYALEKNPKYWLLAGLFAGVVAQFEIAFGFFLIPLILLVGAVSVKQWYRNVWFMGSAAMFLVPFLPLILFDIRHEYLMVRSVLQLFNGSFNPPGDFIPMPLRFFHRLNELLNITVLSISSVPLISWGVFGVVGAYILHASVTKQLSQIKIIIILLLLPALVFIGFMFYSRPAWSYYWIGLQVSYYFLAGFAFAYMFQQKRIVAYILSIFSVVICVVAVRNLYGDTSFLAKEPGIYSNQLRVVDAIYDDARGEQFGVWVYTPPIYDYTYRYLFLWQGEKRGFTPTRQTNTDYYLIIEENTSRPWEIEGWKKSEVRAGTPAWSKMYPGRITVEKISHD